MQAWHFVGNTLRDGRPIPADGEWLVHDGPVVLCESGLHASLDPFDALQYAPGATLCRVALSGEIVRGDDKVAARKRRIIARRDMTDVLRYFARMQALSVVHLCAPCPPGVMLDYLMTGDDSIRAAARAAAARAAAAMNAAWSAARAAARDAAMDAAWSAARAAAARAAAARAAAARAAARAAAKAEFNALVSAEFGL